MAFATGVPTNDPAAEAKIAAACEPPQASAPASEPPTFLCMSTDKTDPGASVNGTYMSALEGIAAAANYPDIRLMSKCSSFLVGFLKSKKRSCAHQPWATSTTARSPS